MRRGEVSSGRTRADERHRAGMLFLLICCGVFFWTWLWRRCVLPVATTLGGVRSTADARSADDRARYPRTDPFRMDTMYQYTPPLAHAGEQPANFPVIPSTLASRTPPGAGLAGRQGSARATRIYVAPSDLGSQP